MYAPIKYNCKLELQSTDGEKYILNLEVVDTKLKLSLNLINTVTTISYESLYSYEDFKKINKFFLLYDNCKEIYTYLKELIAKEKNYILQTEGKAINFSFHPFKQYNQISLLIPQKDIDLHEISVQLCIGINQLRREKNELKEEMENQNTIINDMRTEIAQMSSKINDLSSDVNYLKEEIKKKKDREGNSGSLFGYNQN